MESPVPIPISPEVAELTARPLPEFPLQPGSPWSESGENTPLNPDSLPTPPALPVPTRRSRSAWRPGISFWDLKEVWDEADQTVLLPRPPRRAVLLHTLSGMLGSLLAAAVIFPVETVKLHIQTAPFSDTAGFVGTTLRIVKRHGLLGLYRGLSGTLVKEAVHSLNFWLWHSLLGLQRSLRMPGLQRLARTLAVKQMNWLCTLPFEIVALWQLLSDGRHGFFATALLLYRHGGLGMFYRGLRLSLLLAVNPAIMSVVINLKLRVVWWLKISAGPDADREPDIGAGVVGAVAALSKVLALSLTYPLIRVKVVQQTSRSSQTRRVREILRTVVTAEGFSGLYRGFLPMIYQTLLHNLMMTLLNYQMRPWRISTPPPSPLPEHAAHWLLRKVPQRGILTPFAREPFPADVLVQRMDHIMEQWKDRREKRCKHSAGPETEDATFVPMTPKPPDEQRDQRPEATRALPNVLESCEEHHTIVMLTPQGNILQGEPMPPTSKVDTTP